MIIEWLPLALHHRVEQLEYIALDNPLAAADQDDEIEHQIIMLAAHPKLGRAGRVKGTRELVIGRTPFIAVYRLVGTQRVQILHLLHGSQQWPPAGRTPGRFCDQRETSAAPSNNRRDSSAV